MIYQGSTFTLTSNILRFGDLYRVDMNESRGAKFADSGADSFPLQIYFNHSGEVFVWSPVE